MLKKIHLKRIITAKKRQKTKQKMEKISLKKLPRITKRKLLPRKHQVRKIIRKKQKKQKPKLKLQKKMEKIKTQKWVEVVVLASKKFMPVRK